jgi:hypothetical protein
VNLSVDYHRIDQRSGIMRDHEAQQPYMASLYISLDDGGEGGTGMRKRRCLGGHAGREPTARPGWSR